MRDLLNKLFGSSAHAPEDKPFNSAMHSASTAAVRPSRPSGHVQSRPVTPFGTDTSSLSAMKPPQNDK